MNNAAEPKAIAHMIFDMILGIAVVAAVSAAITQGYRIWDILSKQDSANQRLQNYAEYVAYDNTIIRGQEIINLVSKTKGDPFVAIMSGNDTVALSYNENSEAIVNSITHGTMPVFSYSTSAEMQSAITTFAAEVNHGFTNWSTNINTDDLCLNWDNDSTTYIERIQRWLLHTRGLGEYKAYKTVLVYDKDGSDTVIGIIALEV